jgi:hypothetical protein
MAINQNYYTKKTDLLDKIVMGNKMTAVPLQSLRWGKSKSKLQSMGNEKN